MPYEEYLTVPGDSVGNAADPLFEICGPRTVTLFDLATNLGPMFADVMLDISDPWLATLTVQGTGVVSDIGEHNLRLTYALAAYPIVESIYDFKVTFTCDPSETVTIQNDNSPMTTSFFHDPTASVNSIVDLSLFSWSPPSPCFEYSSFSLNEYPSLLDMTSLFNYSFDGTNSLLTIIGDSNIVN